ncbi:MAG: hypothetical protein AUJ52_06920 [Elusimicrobia bacterium CG1_02_63_36]|nr:MAG: hypothetical protein AUJ52_06920 [Elusimicrobia bacterium CG1_02_63_36]PIP82411.1 MAG: hypothetical protein COR54_14920 [Elusimicrobia bacterium CG22_combo_CG10-13_8_21_14_all_63_91]PJA17598.1 MAG: hypothetical protein COX66_03900 [Elusimicrobia bacterium CG_4_10_14_0_2_um_filter_63_34]PJB26559.1 MAG: hypothetical protein CO113_02840 [Elusimicrobia bacterium CG_4_9_14_3_um_filter_62_55]
MRSFFAVFLCVSLAAEARADLSFVQIVQAQSDRGQDGLFGKAWIEIRGRKMRVVSGYARKVMAGNRTIGPRRLVQILDLPQRERTVLDPDRLRYAPAAIDTLDYGNRLVGVLDKGKPLWRVVRTEARIEKRQGSKQLLGTICAHYHLHAKLTLQDENGRVETARMDQHVWAAPISGTLGKPLMALIAFENDYRKSSGSPLSPLDYERYQVKEAAAYLRVHEDDLRVAVEQIRDRYREMPNYPVASSVSWWPSVSEAPIPDIPRPQPAPAPAPPEAAPPQVPERTGDSTQLVAPRKAAAPKPQFIRIDWRRTERSINSMIRKSRFPFGQLKARDRGGLQKVSQPVDERFLSVESAKPREVYPDFEGELRSILQTLVEAQDDAVRRAADAERRRRREAVQSPFYEIYTELHGLEAETTLPDSDFEIPRDYRASRAPE